MKKFSLLLTLSIMMVGSTVFAGSIDYLSNQSANYVMNVARNAATDAADIVAYNPAGTALMGEGFFIDASSQTVLKYYDQKATLSGTTEKYKMDLPTPVLPNLYAVYNFGLIGAGKFATYAQAGIVAGGGSLEWDGIAALLPYQVGFGASNFSVKGSGVYYAGGLGVAYSLLDDMISVSLGGKIVKGMRTQELHLTALGSNMVQKYEYNALGYTGVVGVDCKPVKELTLGMTYQTATKQDFKYEKETNTSILASVEGKKMRRDLPQIIMLGAQYSVTPELEVSITGQIYLVNKADMGQIGGPTAPTSKDVNKYFGTGYETGFGAKYKVMDALKVGGAFLYTAQGAKDELYTDSNALIYVSSNPVLDSLMFCLGAQYTVMPNLDITLAGNWVHYLPKDATIASSGMKVNYKKEVYTIAIGAGYKI